FSFAFGVNRLWRVVTVIPDRAEEIGRHNICQSKFSHETIVIAERSLNAATSFQLCGHRIDFLDLRHSLIHISEYGPLETSGSTNGKTISPFGSRSAFGTLVALRPWPSTKVPGRTCRRCRIGRLRFHIAQAYDT